MKEMFWGSAVAALLAGAAGGAEPGRSLAEDARAFGARETIINADLSPDGKKVAYVAPSGGSGEVGIVANVETGSAQPFVRAKGGSEALRSCGFVTDTRLICSVYATAKNQQGYLLSLQRLVALNSDGSEVKQLGAPGSFYGSRIHQFDGAVIDWLPGGDGAVLMAREKIPEEGRTGSNLSRSEDGLAVERVDTLTLKSRVVEPAQRDAGEYMTDGRGNVRLKIVAEIDEARAFTGRTQVRYRTAGSRDWKVLSDFGDPDIVPLAIDAELDSLYALKKLDGREALYRIRLGARPQAELVAAHPRVDIDDVVRSANGQRVIGYTFVDDKRQTKYFDADQVKLQAALGRALPNLPIIQFAGASADGTKRLLFAGSDSDPGRYYLFDIQAKKLSELMLVRPALEKRTLASVQPISVRAGDGTSIPAYLTLPPGKEPKNLPAVVLPHGGPSSRDEWGFDWLAQFLAARGYAVLQPNYRGSAGFGDAWLVENGFKSWRTSIGDITASARWLASEGIADPKRLAIVGWSYGGYAALQAAATEPALFKSVTAVAPVTDLSLLKDEAEQYTNYRLTKSFVGDGPHVAEGSPLRRANAIKAPVLLAHGDLDLNVGIAHSERMADALRGSGTPVEFLQYRGLNHQLDDSAARIELLTKIGEMLERTIGL